jgi:Ig-like domain-containing protein
MLGNKLIHILIAGIFLLTACGGSNADLTPTLDANLIQTQAVKTFSAALTQTALAAPSNTPFPTLTASATFAPFATSVSTLSPISQPTIAPTKSCYSMAFVSDVTIPDNTPVAPGQTFTKTWKVVNNGSCPWDAGFKFAFTGGDAMSGATYTLPSAVAVNAIVDLSIAMTAPTNKTGAIRSNWRMSTAGGQFFGDEVYVVVTVGGGTLTPTATGAPPATATATATATQTPTATATP